MHQSYLFYTIRNYLVLIVLIFSLSISTSFAERTGRTGSTLTTSRGCGTCHGSANTGISITPQGTFNVRPGSNNVFQILVSASGKTVSGINLAVKNQNNTNFGTFVASTGFRIQNSELTHSTPWNMSNGTAIYEFTWQAPQETGVYSLRAVALAGNGNNSADAGDIWNWMTPVVITVSTGPGELSATPTSLDFGDIKLTRTLDKQFTVTNIGQLSLTVNSLSVNGANKSEFIVTSGLGGFTLEPGESRPFNVRFAPSSIANSKSATISFSATPSTNVTISLKGKCSSAPTAIITPSTQTVNFGQVKITQVNKQSFTVRNSGDMTLDVTGSHITGDNETEFSILSDTAFTLEPNSLKTVEVAFHPNSLGENKKALLNFVSNAKTNPVILLNGTGVPAPKIILTALPSIDFNQIMEGETKDSSIAIMNAGEGDLIITDVLIAGPDSADFSIVKNLKGDTIKPLDENELIVRFEPKTPGENKSAEIVFVCNDTAAPKIQLLGNATEAPKPKIMLSTNDIDCGIVYNEKYKDTTFIISNIGTADLVISNLELTGDSAASFSLPNLEIPKTIPASQQEIITVRFSPKATGIHTAKIIITSNVTGGNEINLTGTGEPDTGVQDGVQSGAIALYPNPANDVVSIRLNQTGNIRSISIFDAKGTTVKDFDTQNMNSTTYLNWDCKDKNGNKCPSGVYYIIIHDNGQGLLVPVTISR